MEDKEEQKKQTKRDWGATLGNIVQIIKYLKNPIILKIAIILLIILLIIGVIAFFTSLPSNVLGLIAELLGGEKDPFIVEAKEIKELCIQLEDHGYDLEGYGFVEEIVRDGDKTYSDTEFDGDKPTKGAITSIKSKYLEAYLIAEKKAYVIANNNKDYDFSGQNNNERMLNYAFPLIWPIGQEGTYFEVAINKIYDFDGRQYKFKLKDFDGFVEINGKHYIIDEYVPGRVSHNSYYEFVDSDLMPWGGILIPEKYLTIEKEELRERIKELFAVWIKIQMNIEFTLIKEEAPLYIIRRNII